MSRPRLRPPRFTPEQWIGLGLLLVALCLAVVYLIGDAGRSTNRDLINDLACQVVELGGQPVADVPCHPPKASPTTTPVPSASFTPRPARTKVRVVPQPQRTVIRQPGGTRTVTASPRADKRPGRTPPPPSRTPRPTPSPTRCPLVICLPL